MMMTAISVIKKKFAYLLSLPIRSKGIRYNFLKLEIPKLNTELFKTYFKT